MKKFLAVVKHEYKKIVLKWSFLIGTLLFPIIAAGFAIVPAIIFSIKGEPTRIAIVDLSGKIAPRIKANLSAERLKEKSEQVLKDAMKDVGASPDKQIQTNAELLGGGIVFSDYGTEEKSDEQIRRELNGQIQEKKLDGYLIIPPNYEAADSKFEFRSRKAGDFSTERNLKDAINEAVRSERLAKANISEERLKDLSKNVNFDAKSLDETGGEKNSDAVFITAFIIALMIYITLAIYGQMILGAVVEEKETRIAEILFSSAKPFELMMGKLVGVGLAGLTQLSIWILSAVIAAGFGATLFSAAGMDIAIPNISPLMVILFFVYFLLGFFIYASIFALIGSMVTTVQEGGQFSFPPIMLLLVGFYFSFAVIRDPSSSLSFWVSIAPFFAPITMPVRILAETPPYWQIALSIAINAATIAFLVWLAARVYRVGMLMYGKRATLPEVWKWIRQ